MPQQSWLDEEGQSTTIDDYARQLGSYIDSLSDGQVDAAEVDAQEQRVVALIKEVEPLLSDDLHAKLTELLCEISAFSAMQMLHMLCQERMDVSKLKL